MDLLEAFSVLEANGEIHHPKWMLWKPKRILSAKPIEGACDLIASFPPETVIPNLARIIWNANDQLAQKLHPLFMAMSANLPVPMWPLIDDKIRHQLEYSITSPRGIGGDPLPETESMILIALCHSSGRLREKAIQISEQVRPTLAVPLLLIRVNDWVQPVRNAAASKLTKPLQSLSSEEKLALLPVLLRLRECGRHSRHDMLDSWLGILTTPFDEKAWLAAWQAASGKNRRGYLEVLKTSGHLPSATTRQELLGSNNRLALFWYIREVLPKLDTSGRNDAHFVIRKSRVAAARRVWLSHCLETHSSLEVEQLLREALLDRNRSIRQFARFHLTRISLIDITAFYREALSQAETEATALVALAEVAPEEAHREAVSRLGSHSPALLKAALTSLSSESLGQYLQFLMDSIESALPGVSKIARKRLFEIRRIVGTELVAKPDWWDQFQHSTKLHMIHMAPHFQKWDCLEFLLAHLHEGPLFEDAVAALRIWKGKGNRSFSRLAPARRQKLLSAIESGKLPSGYLEHLRFLVANSE